MAITLNGSGTITGVSSLATALVNPVVTTTMGVGNATPAASGAGITFPAAVSASSDVNTLDDYEEGTFTPSVNGASTAGTFNYSNREGKYTKVGDVVAVQIAISVTSTSVSASGVITITGLPFALGQITFQTFAIGWVGNITFADYITAYGNVGNTSITLRNSATTTFGGEIQGSNLAGSFYIFLGGTYKI